MIFYDKVDVLGLLGSPEPKGLEYATAGLGSPAGLGYATVAECNQGNCGFEYLFPCSSGCQGTAANHPMAVLKADPCKPTSYAKLPTGWTMPQPEKGMAGRCVAYGERKLTCNDGRQFNVLASGDTAPYTGTSCGHLLEKPCATGCLPGMVKLVSMPSSWILPDNGDTGFCVPVGTTYDGELIGTPGWDQSSGHRYCDVNAAGVCVERSLACPPGQVFDPGSQECHPPVAVCPPGQVPDRTNKCVPRRCGAGWVILRSLPTSTSWNGQAMSADLKSHVTVGDCVPVKGILRASSKSRASCDVNLNADCIELPAWLDRAVPLPLWPPGQDTRMDCKRNFKVAMVDSAGATSMVDCSKEYIVHQGDDAGRSPDWLVACAKASPCTYPNFVNAHAVHKMPFPTGSKLLKTSQGYDCIAIPETPEIVANYNLWLAEHKKNLEQGKDTFGMYPKVLAGTTPYGWALAGDHNVEWNAYGRSPPPGAPPLINPGDVKPASYSCEFTYDRWGYYYGTETKGWLLLINVGYANSDNMDVIPWLTDPFKFLARMVIAAVVEIIKEVVEIVKEVVEDIGDAVKDILCSLGPAGAVVSGAAGAYFGGPAGLAAATKAYGLLCAGGSCSNGMVMDANKQCVCPTGFTKDAASGVCVMATTDTGTILLYVGIGAVVLLVGYMALKPKKKAPPAAPAPAAPVVPAAAAPAVSGYHYR